MSYELRLIVWYRSRYSTAMSPRRTSSYARMATCVHRGLEPPTPSVAHAVICLDAPYHYPRGISLSQAPFFRRGPLLRMLCAFALLSSHLSPTRTRRHWSHLSPTRRIEPRPPRTAQLVLGDLGLSKAIGSDGASMAAASGAASHEWGELRASTMVRHRHVSAATCPPPRVLRHVSTATCPPPRVRRHVSSAILDIPYLSKPLQ